MYMFHRSNRRRNDGCVWRQVNIGNSVGNSCWRNFSRNCSFAIRINRGPEVRSSSFNLPVLYRVIRGVTVNTRSSNCSCTSTTRIERRHIACALLHCLLHWLFLHTRAALLCHCSHMLNKSNVNASSLAPATTSTRAPLNRPHHMSHALSMRHALHLATTSHGNQ